MKKSDGAVVGHLFSTSIPEATLSVLGPRFVAHFLYGLSRCERTGVWVAHDHEDRIGGFIAGTLSRRDSYRELLRRHGPALLLLGSPGVFSPGVWRWGLSVARVRLCGLLKHKYRDATPESAEPDAELLAVAVTEAWRGAGLARRLVEYMEGEFRRWGFRNAYKILTLNSNAPSNAFYRKLGARQIAQNRVRNRIVNTYAKTVGD